MIQLRCFLTAALITGTLILGTQEARAYDEQLVGSWGVRAAPNRGLCVAIQGHREINQQDAILLIVRDRSSYALQVVFPNSQERDNLAYISGRAVIDGSTYGLEGFYSALRRTRGELPYLSLLLPAEVRRPLADGQTLTVYVGARIFSFPLDWSLEALDELDECYAQGAAGSVQLTLALQTSITRDGALQAAARDPEITASCANIGIGVGHADFAQCRMMMLSERASLASRERPSRRDDRTDALLDLSSALLQQGSPAVPPSRTTIYHFGRRVIQCTQAGTVVNCE